MNNLEKRRDRFEFFEGFENPMLNMTFTLEVEDFLSYCKEKGHPPFHFFLYHLVQSIQSSENFLYRIMNDEVIRITEIIPSYTVMGPDELFNYTHFKHTNNFEEFIRRSLGATREASSMRELVNTGVGQPVEDLKKHVFITSIPWLEFTSIQHPVYRFRSADIPAFAWGKFKKMGDKISMPFSIQAHHGFVDAIHMHKLAEDLKDKISAAMGN